MRVVRRDTGEVMHSARNQRASFAGRAPRGDAGRDGLGLQVGHGFTYASGSHQHAGVARLELVLHQAGVLANYADRLDPRWTVVILCFYCFFICVYATRNSFRYNYTVRPLL